jgi:hypothetical protein
MNLKTRNTIAKKNNLKGMRKVLVILGFLSFSVTAQKMTIEVTKKETYDRYDDVSIDSCLQNPDTKWVIENSYSLYIIDLDLNSCTIYNKDPNLKGTPAYKFAIDVTNTSSNVMNIRFIDPTNVSNWGLIVDKNNSQIKILHYNIGNSFTIVDKFVKFKVK